MLNPFTGSLELAGAFQLKLTWCGAAEPVVPPGDPPVEPSVPALPVALKAETPNSALAAAAVLTTYLI
jgi:hypothetical protein